MYQQHQTPLREAPGVASKKLLPQHFPAQRRGLWLSCLRPIISSEGPWGLASP